MLMMAECSSWIELAVEDDVPIIDVCSQATALMPGDAEFPSDLSGLDDLNTVFTDLDEFFHSGNSFTLEFLGLNASVPSQTTQETSSLFQFPRLLEILI